MNTVYLFGEQHDNHEDRMQELRWIKQLSTEQKIGCVSVELPFEKFEHIINNYNHNHEELSLGRTTTLIHLAKKRNLDVIASDYRGFAAGKLYSYLEEQDNILREEYQDKDIERMLNKKLAPLQWEGPRQKAKVYDDINPELAQSRDIIEFVAKLYQEERDSFTFHRINQYILTKNKNVMHVAGKNHISRLAEKFSDKYTVEILHE